ncbi:MAG: CRISPR-associated endonuclease Cas1 [Saprospiraceae bacterium]
MQLVLDTNEITLRVRNRAFLVQSGTEARLIAPHRLSSIAVLGRCTLTSAAILLAAEHQVPILFFDETGNAAARLGSAQFGGQAELRRAQVLFTQADEAVDFAVNLFQLKTAAQLEHLKQMDVTASAIQPLEALLPKLHPAQFRPADPEVFAQLMGIEGSIARLYWQALGSSMPKGYQFEQRSRRPAADCFNAALNYSYGMLYNVVESAALAAGLDPMLGIIHADQYGEATLAFDLIEPFRPAADRLVVQLFQSGQIEAKHFEFRGADEGVWVGREGRRVIIPAFNDYLQAAYNWRDQTASLKNHIYQFAGELAAQLKQFWDNDPAIQLRHRRRPPSTPDGE